MSNELDRTEKEMKNLFADPKFKRQAWQAVGMAILKSPCTRPVGQIDKDGNPTLASDIEAYSYQKLKNDISNLGKEDREPTELEMIMQSQIIRARYDTAAATFVRDTLGAKPVDETKVDAQINNPYEDLSDEELQMIKEMRDKKAIEANSAAQLPEASQSLVDSEQITIDEVLDDGRQEV